jgi:sensor histidine kinase YesM
MALSSTHLFWLSVVCVLTGAGLLVLVRGDAVVNTAALSLIAAGTVVLGKMVHSASTEATQQRARIKKLADQAQETYEQTKGLLVPRERLEQMQRDAEQRRARRKKEGS